jgi:hypothetical protein
MNATPTSAAPACAIDIPRGALPGKPIRTT